MSNEFEKELLNEDLKSVDDALKKIEKAELPQSLSAENIEKMLVADANEQKVTNVTPLPEKKNHKKYIGAIASVAAVFVVAFVSLFAIKPWDKPAEAVKPAEPNGAPANDYVQIEEMFRDYSQKYNSRGNDFKEFVDGFGVKNEAAIMEDSIVFDSAVSTGASSSASSNSYAPTEKYGSAQLKGEYGKTNEQVAGVSEADVIKNDGKYLYSVSTDNADWDKYYRQMDSYRAYLSGDEETTFSGQTSPGYNPQAKDDVAEIVTEDPNEYKVQTTMPVLEYNCGFTIVEPLQNGKFNRISSVKITENTRGIYHATIEELYVNGDKLVALLDCSTMEELTEENVKEYYTGRLSKQITMAVCFDITDRKNPTEMWRTYQDGSYISSRLIGEQLVIMSTYGVNLDGDEEKVVENCIPMYGVASDYARVPCDCICIMEEIYDTRYLVASTVNLNDVNTLKTQAVLGAGEDVYCTTETLYAVSTRYDKYNTRAEIFNYASEPQTQIYKFDIRNGDIKYLGNGTVKGSTLNQFSMDEHNGYLRIATTTGSWGDSLENQVYILDEALQIVGEITGIAKGETIKSVRFTGDTGYVVTFEQTDPLFVMDLSNPQSPVITGELKIPGFSAYLHPVGDGLLLGVGVDGDENGENGGMKLSLFDVSDPQNPVECDKITVSAPQGENNYTYLRCDAYYTHKALCWDDVNSVMYVPYVEMIDIYTNTDYDHKEYSNILAVKVDAQNKKLISDKGYKVLTSEGDINSYGGFSRVTYIDNVIMGYVQEGNAFYSFDKTTKEYFDKIKLG